MNTLSVKSVLRIGIENDDITCRVPDITEFTEIVENLEAALESFMSDQESLGVRKE